MIPAVSVCVPTRDRAALLAEALASALGQQGPELEVVVCDDGSADATADVLAQIGDPRLRVVRNAAPLGVSRARDRCVELARGRYVAFLDSDDALLPGALARQVAVLDRRADVAFVHGACLPVGEDGEALRGFDGPFTEDTVEDGPAAFGHLLAANEVVTSTVVARRSALDAAGSPGAPLASSSDWATWLRLALHGGVAYTAVPVARYRHHRRTVSHAVSGAGERLRCDVAVVRELLRGEASRVADPRRARSVASAALAAKAVLHAGDALTRGERLAAGRAAGLAGRLVPAAASRCARLGAAARAGDDATFHRCSQALLGDLAARLHGTRFAARLAAAAARDPAWDAALARAAAVVDRVVPDDGCVGAVAKWDPALLTLSGRRGRNFPDRRTLPDGYPADSAAAVAHLEEQRRDGLSHLVVPSPSRWWLEHYDGLAAHLDARHRRVHDDGDCLVFDLRARGAA